LLNKAVDYAAVARRFAAVLVTLDSEQAQRAEAVIPVRLPAPD